MAILIIPASVIIVTASYYGHLSDSNTAAQVTASTITDNGDMGLYLLSLAEELNNHHDKQMWILATWMLFNGYTDSNGEVAVLNPNTVFQSTFGIRNLCSPDQTPYETSWKLCRAGSPVCGISFFSFAVDSNYNYDLEEAFREEWSKTDVRGPFSVEEGRAIGTLFNDALELWKRDRHPAYYSNPSKDDTDRWIKRNHLKLQNRYDCDNPPYYTMTSIKKIGNYNFSIMIREDDKWANEPPSTYILVSFEYIKDKATDGL